MKISPAHAADILAKNPGMPKRVAAAFEAARDGQLAQFYLERLRERRHEYCDDVPEPAVPPTHPAYAALRLQATWDHPRSERLKCRAHFIIGLTSVLESIVENEFIEDPAIPAQFTRFREHSWQAFKGSKGMYWTTPEEIAFMNKTMDVFLEPMERTYGRS
jgi:hypothetical protein